MTVLNDQTQRGDEREMDGLIENLQQALAHLYDPGYRPAPSLLRLAGLDDRAGHDVFRRCLVREIESLEPAPEIPDNARSRRIFGLLSLLYVQAMTQEDAAENLGITARHLRRDRGDAVRILAQRMLDKHRLSSGLGPEWRDDQPSDSVVDQAENWSGQLQREIQSLQSGGGSGVTTDLGQVVARAAEIAQVLTERQGVEMEVIGTSSLVSVPLHPSVLRQALFGAVSELTKHMDGGTLEIVTEAAAEHQARITVRGEPARLDGEPDLVGLRELILVQGGAVGYERVGHGVAIWIELPAVRRRVLVVDDNLDMVHLYRRYVKSTPYHLDHCQSGGEVLERVAKCAPDIIVLDVMLPDIDGWELLSRLREEPMTESIPIIVCSVVREQGLAEALGANAYLTKPIHRQAFVDALDQLALGLGEHESG